MSEDQHTQQGLSQQYHQPKQELGHPDLESERCTPSPITERFEDLIEKGRENYLRLSAGKTGEKAAEA